MRDDIAAQLHLKNPAVLVGTFDRPNLTYRILPRVNLVDQVAEALRRHADRAAIVYCISRKDTESLALDLTAMGIPAKAYHAGLVAMVRTRVQGEFKSEKLNVVVATVAFGMGIDRGDVRCVIHAAMPKTVEHYQQETGRAGRDGLPAECVLFYSAADIIRWQKLMQRGADESQADPRSVAAGMAIQTELLEHARRLCTSAARATGRLSEEYFGQEYHADPHPAPDGRGTATRAMSACTSFRAWPIPTTSPARFSRVSTVSIRTSGRPTCPMSCAAARERGSSSFATTSCPPMACCGTFPRGRSRAATSTNCWIRAC